MTFLSEKASLIFASLFLATAPIPWFFIIVGIITLVLAGVVIYAIVKAARKRKEMKEKDESVYEGR
jgi:Ca2+/Na+ antiporter